MKPIRYYNNPNYKDRELVNYMRSRTDGKHYNWVEQGRRFSDQAALKGILKNLKPGAVIETEDITTLVAGSLNYLVDVLAYIVRKGATVRTAQGDTIGPDSPHVSIAAMRRYRDYMRSAIRTETSGRPRKDLDVAKAKMLIAQGLSKRHVANQLGVSTTTLDRHLASEKKVAEVVAKRD